MNNLNLGGRLRILALVFVIFSSCCINYLRGQEPVSNSQIPNFEVFLQYPPIVRKATFELESFFPNQPPSKEVFSIKFDGDNYFVEKDEANAVAHGKFNGVYWQMEHRVDLLVLYDPKINASGSWSVPGSNYELGPDGKRKGPGFENEDAQFFTKKEMNFLLNLGAPGLDRGKEVTWDKSQGLLLGRVISAPIIKPELRNSTCAIQLNYSNALPIGATVTLGSPSSATYLIEYTYSSNFYAGQFPVEFTRFRKVHGKESVKEWTMRIKELQIVSQHLAEADIDPIQVFKSPRLETHFWSNNIAYEKTRLGGFMRQVFGPKELAEQSQLRLEHLHGGRLKSLRISIFLIFLVSGICMVWFAVRNKNKNK